MDITVIPGIMRRKGWLNGARLQDIWFSRFGNSEPEKGVPDTTTIKLGSRALTFPRCSAVYHDIVQQKPWLSEEPRRWLCNRLTGKGLFQSQRTTFGDLSRPVSHVNADYIHMSPVGSILDPLDDMYAALGRFNFRVAVSGSIVPAGTVPMPPGAVPSVRCRLEQHVS